MLDLHSGGITPGLAVGKASTGHHCLGAQLHCNFRPVEALSIVARLGAYEYVLLEGDSCMGLWAKSANRTTVKSKRSCSIEGKD